MNWLFSILTRLKLWLCAVYPYKWMGENSSFWGEIRGDYLVWTVSTPRTETSLGKLADLLNIPFFTHLLFFLCHFNITSPAIYLGCTVLSCNVFNLLLWTGKDLVFCSLWAQGGTFSNSFTICSWEIFVNTASFNVATITWEPQAYTLQSESLVRGASWPFNKAVIYGFPLIKYY